METLVIRKIFPELKRVICCIVSYYAISTSLHILCLFLSLPVDFYIWLNQPRCWLFSSLASPPPFLLGCTLLWLESHLGFSYKYVALVNARHCLLFPCPFHLIYFSVFTPFIVHLYWKFQSFYLKNRESFNTSIFPNLIPWFLETPPWLVHQNKHPFATTLYFLTLSPPMVFPRKA